jgi:hypothetical protein
VEEIIETTSLKNVDLEIAVVQQSIVEEIAFAVVEF